MDDRQLEGWNACLPPDLRAEEARARPEHEAWFEHVVVGFARSMAAGHLGRSGRKWVRAAQTHVLDLQRPAGSAALRAYFLRLLYDAVTGAAELDPTLQTKWAGVLTRLLKKWKSLAGSELTLPWRPLYDTLVSVLVQGLRQPMHQAVAIHSYQLTNLIGLARRSRRFFSAEAPTEICETLDPYFCPHDNSSVFRAQALLCFFMPSFAYTKELLDGIFEKWAWIEHSGTWDANWLSLLARFAKAAHSSLRNLDWTPYSPHLFTHTLRILDVSTAGASKLPKPGQNHSPKELHIFSTKARETKVWDMAKTLIYALQPSQGEKPSAELLSLRQLFRSIESYYYPSNSGGWSDRLASFLKAIAHHYVHRVGKERTSGHAAQSNVLTDFDHKYFISMLEEPLKQAIYGKGSISSAATEALRHLSYIAPDLIFPDLLKRIYNALESLTATNQTLNAIETLISICHPLFDRQNYPLGAHHLPQLLRLTLPGIDPNDRKKTVATYGFYSALFSNIPLFDSSSIPANSSGKRRKQKQKENDNDSAAKEATNDLADWCSQLLDSLFSILSNQDKMGRDDTDYAARYSFKRMVDLFFQQLSPSIFQTLSKKLLHFVTYNVITNATKEFGFILASASLANPEAVLNSFLPLFLKKLTKTDKATGQATLKDRSDDEFSWFLHLLSSVVKGTGNAIIPHVEKLRTLLTLCFASGKKGLAKEAGKILRNMLHSLTRYYPTDYRSVPPSIWNSQDMEQNHWKVWGHQDNRQSLEVMWHQPTLEELQIANQLLNNFLTPILPILLRSIEKDEFWIILQQIRSIVRGAATILPQENGQEPDREQFDFEARQQSQPHPITYPQQLQQLINEQNGVIRQEIIRTIDAASKAYIKTRPDDIKGLSQLIKTMDILLNLNGIPQEKLSRWIASQKGTKHRYSKLLEAEIQNTDTCSMDIENSSSKKPQKKHYRRIMVDRAHIQYLKQVNQRNWGNQAGDNSRKLISTLYDLSTGGCSYAVIRKKAQHSLHNVSKYRPFVRHFFLDEIFAKLRDPTVSEDELKGNAFLLCHRSFIRLISRDWRYLSPFVVSISSSHVHSNEKLQALLYQLFILYSISSYSLPLRASPPSVALPAPPANIAGATVLSEAVIQSAKKDVDFHTRKNSESYNNALRDLIAIAEDSKLHWRYQVISSACVLFLLRPDPLPPLPIVRLFLKGTINELQPMRTLSRKALSILLKIFKPNLPREPREYIDKTDYLYNIAQAQPLAVEEWRNAIFVDNNWAGWNSSVQAKHKKSIQAASGEAIKQVSDEIANFMNEVHQKEKFFYYLTQDHYVRAEEAEEKSHKHSLKETAKQFSSMLGGSIGRFVRSALGGDLGQIGQSVVAQAATELLRELLKERKQWPYVAPKVPAASPNSFIQENAQLFKGLFQLALTEGDLSTLFDSHLRPFLDSFLRSEHDANTSNRLHAGDQERNHALASEIMAGMFRCLKYAGPNFAERTWSYWLPFLEKIIASAPMDCVRNWLMGLRFGIYNLDVRRIVPLGGLLIKQLQNMTTDTKKEGDSLRDVKILQFIQPYLAETSWRTPRYSHQVLDLLATRLASPFKQVREELAHTLIIIFRNLWNNPYVTASTEESSRFFAHISAQVFNMKTADNEKMEEEKDTMEEESDATSLTSEDVSHLRETLLLTMAYALRSAAVGATSPHVHHFLKVVFASLVDEDRDTVNVAKHCAALVAQAVLLDRTARISFVSHLMELPRPDTLWHVRAAMLPFLQIFVFNHRFLLAEDDIMKIRELVLSLLTDARIEVRELASGSLSSLLHGDEDSLIKTLIVRFFSTLGEPITRRTLKKAPEEKIRQAAALGLAAIVQSVPYTVPTWLPALIVQMAPYEEDAHSSVKDTMKKTFAEFMRTHQEAWELHQEAFTEDQLAIVSTLGKTPTSYYL